MRLKRIIIKKLYGSLDRDVQFNDELSLLVGINGSGKTSVLNAIHWMLNASYIPLCTTFAVQRFNLGIKNCDLKPEQFTVATPSELDPSRVDEYKEKVLERVRAMGVFASDKEFMDFMEGAFPARLPREAVVSGKFILGLCYHHLRKTVLMEMFHWSLSATGSRRMAGFMHCSHV